MTEKFRKAVTEVLEDGNLVTDDKRKLHNFGQLEGISSADVNNYLAKEVLKNNSKINGFKLTSFGIAAVHSSSPNIIELLIKIIENLDKIKDFSKFISEKFETKKK